MPLIIIMDFNPAYLSIIFISFIISFIIANITTVLGIQLYIDYKEFKNL
ncbi:hypothetical protein GMMP1_1330009 [Candidatus Magnetomoraceae bacterium gMMP-1]